MSNSNDITNYNCTKKQQQLSLKAYVLNKYEQLKVILKLMFSFKIV